MPCRSFWWSAWAALSFVFGISVSPTSALAQGGFDDDVFPPPGADPEEIVELCLARADERFGQRMEGAESSLKLCLGAGGVVEVAGVAACIILSGGVGTIPCLGGGAAGGAGILVLCGDNYASAVMEAELQLEFETDTCQMVGAMGRR